MALASEIFKLNTHELPRRAGEMKEYKLDLKVIEKVGVGLIAIPAGEIIEVDARLEAVTQGVLLTAQIYATAFGECIRCLDPVKVEIDRPIQELYFYESKPERGARRKKVIEKNEDDLDSDDELHMDGDIMDLGIPIRDAIVLALPINPLCSPECAGLCQECGEKWASLFPDHVHEVIDARWARLSGLAVASEIDPDFRN